MPRNRPIPRRVHRSPRGKTSVARRLVFFTLTWLRLRLAGYRQKTSVTLERERGLSWRWKRVQLTRVMTLPGRCGVAKRASNWSKSTSTLRKMDGIEIDGSIGGNRPDVDNARAFPLRHVAPSRSDRTRFFTPRRFFRGVGGTDGHARDFWDFV